MSSHREGFAFRLFLGVAASLLAAGLGAYALIVHRVQADVAAGETSPDAVMDTVRESLLVLSLPAILGSLALFWLLSGRTLHRRHRSLLERAWRDGLTDLGNHRAFQDELRRAEGLTQRSGLEFALAVFDVDDFKFINDRRGHQHGDDILRRVAKVLTSGRAQDRAFRTGGDEFALIMPATDEYGGRAAAMRIRRLMADSGVTVSCGLSATRERMRLGAVLREEADAALYEAKRRRSDDIVCYSEVGEDAAIFSPEKAHGLRLLLQDRVIDVALQPIWDLESGTLLGLEGLARPHVEYGLSGPAEAFDVAEQTGRIADLDRLCVDRILERAGELPRGARLFVNVHPSSLEDEDGEWIFDALRRARVHHERIVVEVTERSGARVAAVVRAIASLRARGLKVALDDVGAGNSGLQMLHSVPVDYVKIDRMVVVRAMEETSARAVLAAIIAFAETSGTYVIAEGIEDGAMLAFLRGLEVRASNGIRGGQGYGLGRPASTVAAAIAGGAPVSEVVEVVQPEMTQQLAGLDVQVRELA